MFTATAEIKTETNLFSRDKPGLSLLGSLNMLILEISEPSETSDTCKSARRVSSNAPPRPGRPTSLSGGSVTGSVTDHKESFLEVIRVFCSYTSPPR